MYADAIPPHVSPGASQAIVDACATPTDKNGTDLTPRERQVLDLVVQGKTNKQIATELGLSEKTVKAHVTAIFKVLGVVNRPQAVLVARRVGMITN